MLHRKIKRVYLFVIESLRNNHKISVTVILRSLSIECVLYLETIVAPLNEARISIANAYSDRTCI